MDKQQVEKQRPNQVNNIICTVCRLSPKTFDNFAPKVSNIGNKCCEKEAKTRRERTEGIKEKGLARKFLSNLS